MMTRHTLFLMAAVFTLYVATVNSFAVQLKMLRLDQSEAQRLNLKSKQYQVQMMNVTMYAPLSTDAISGLDYFGDRTRTASGEKVVPGKTAAAGPDIPFGTRIYVEGLGWRIVHDRGSAIGPYDLDLAVKTRTEAIKFGMQQRLVIIKAP